MQFTNFLLATLVGAAAALPVTGDSSTTSVSSTASGSKIGTKVRVTFIVVEGRGDDITETIDLAKGGILPVAPKNERAFTGLRLEKGGIAELVQCEGLGDNGVTTDPFGIGFGGSASSNDDDVLALGAFILRAVACEFKIPSM